MAKKAYRVRNWKDYNQALVNRGSITFWIDEQTIEDWHSKLKPVKRGRPLKYSDDAIICALTLKAIYKLTYRSTEGFLSSLIKLLNLDIDAPDYSLLCKRQSKLNIPLPTKNINPGEPVNIVIDATGLKIFGEGEWKVRRHGYTKKRVWRKLHLAINSETQEIESFELTELGVQDCQGFSKVMEKIKKPIKVAIGDGAYDRFSCYEFGTKNNFSLVAPPQKNARTSKEKWDNRKKASPEAVKARDDTVLRVREKGSSEWKKEVGYHKRSLAETAMFRVKTLLGNRLKSKLFSHQCIEVAIWCRAINKLNTLGMPITVAAAA